MLFRGLFYYFIALTASSNESPEMFAMFLPLEEKVPKTKYEAEQANFAGCVDQINIPVFE